MVSEYAASCTVSALTSAAMSISACAKSTTNTNLYYKYGDVDMSGWVQVVSYSDATCSTAKTLTVYQNGKCIPDASSSNYVKYAATGFPSKTTLGYVNIVSTYYSDGPACNTASTTKAASTMSSPYGGCYAADGATVSSQVYVTTTSAPVVTIVATR